MKKNLVDPISFIKALAAASVFMFHTTIFSRMFGLNITENIWFFDAPGQMTVWIFFFLSGFLNIGGFLGENPRYSLTMAGIKDFYVRRFKKVLLPVWCFDIIALTISEPSFVKDNPGVIWKILTFTYFSEPGCTSIAATWYVSTLTWLYVLTPAIAFICRKIEGSAASEKRSLRAEILFVVMLTAGLGLRFLLYKTGLDWTKYVAVPVYASLDIYVCGVLAFITAEKRKVDIKLPDRVKYVLSIGLTAALLTAACRVYYMRVYSDKYLLIYEYLIPTIVIIVMAITCILVRSIDWKYEKAEFGTLKKNPFRIIDLFAGISFEFYLVHSMILFHIGALVGGAGVGDHLRLLVVAFVMSTVIAILLKRATKFT